MDYKIATENFSGPLDLLLQLIERQELDITKISLAKVADEYLRYVRTSTQINPDELADFLLIAARLILLKSKALLPNLEISDEPGDLETQLKLYKEFVIAAENIEAIIKKKKFSYSRERLPIGIEPEFNPPKKLNVSKMVLLFQEIVERLRPLVELPERMVKKIISIEEKIAQIRELVISKIETTFAELVGHGDKAEKIVGFLALLELVKQRTISIEQEQMFGEILVKKN